MKPSGAWRTRSRKILSPALISDPVLKQGFLQEARAAARINHPAGRKVPWAQGITDVWDELRQMLPSQYIWYSLGLGAALGRLYFSVSKIGFGGMVFLVILALFLYNKIRNRLDTIQSWFVRRVSSILKCA